MSVRSQPERRNDGVRPQAPAESDELLVERCRQGSEAAFAALVRRHEHALHRHCATMVGQSAAGDATQEAFLSAWSAIRAGAEVRLLRPWLFTIAHRKALGLLRERRRAPVELLEQSLSNGVSSAEQAQLTARARETLAVLAALPEDQREALLGVAVQGRSGRQVANQLGVSESSARQLVFRARATLRAGSAVCVGPPLLLGGWMRRLLGTARRLGGAARGGLGCEQAAASAKVAAVALLGVAAVGAGTLRLGATAARAHRPGGGQITAIAARSPVATVPARQGNSAHGALPVSPASAGAARRLIVVHAAGQHRSRLSPAALRAAALGGAPAVGAPAAGAPAAAQALATAAPARSGAHAGSTAREPASALLEAGATAAVAVAPDLGHRVVALASGGAGALRDTVAAAGGTIHNVLQGTVATANRAVATLTGALGVSVAASAASAAPSGAAVATSVAATTASGGQAAAGTVADVVAAGSQALAPLGSTASSSVAQTTGAVASTASGGVGAVLVGATGAVSTLGSQLAGG
jgi:RNA polymerase sigma factor (sigma-70 family)